MAKQVDLFKEYEHNFVGGSAILDKKPATISVSPKIDFMLGGGIPEGSFVILTGKPKLGKTTLALTIAAGAQQVPFRGKKRHVYFFNIEGRLKSRDVAGIIGLDSSDENFTCIESVEGKLLSGEDYIKIGNQKIHTCPGDIFIFDSFSQICTKGRQENEIGDRYRDDAPAMLSDFCKRISNVIPVNNSIVIGMTHIIADTGRSMKQYAEASGNKVQYQSDVKLRVTHAPDWMEGEKQVGQVPNWVCEWSAIGPPGRKCESYLRYGYGVDREAELIDMCVDLGLISRKGGGWHTFPNEEKIQGLNQAADYLRQNSSYYEELNSEYRELIGFPKNEITDSGQSDSKLESQGESKTKKKRVKATQESA